MTTKKKRIINAAIWLAVAIIVNIAVVAEWTTKCHETRILILAETWHVLQVGIICGVIDQSIQGK